MTAIAGAVLGVGAVVAVEVDRSLARQGSLLPEQLWTVTRWFALGFGVAAIALWALERRRSHTPITVGVIIAIVAVVGTPIALAIAQPDDRPTTVVVFDTHTGHRRWQYDVDLLQVDPPMRLDAQNHLARKGPAGNGRCNTRPDRFTLDAQTGQTLSRETDVGSPSYSPPRAPRAAGDIEIEMTRAAPTDPLGTLRANDPTGRELWSIPVEVERPPVLYADPDVVAVYVAGTGPDSLTPAPGSTPSDPKTAVDLLDARTGRRRWTLHPSLFETPVFNREAIFAIEGERRVVVYATTTGAVLARHPLGPPVEQTPLDAQLHRAAPDDSIALVEGAARRLTLFDGIGKVRWTTNLPRPMLYPTLTALDDAIYVAGGGTQGYNCGGE